MTRPCPTGLRCKRPSMTLQDMIKCPVQTQLDWMPGVVSTQCWLAASSNRNSNSGNASRKMSSVKRSGYFLWLFRSCITEKHHHPNESCPWDPWHAVDKYIYIVTIKGMPNMRGKIIHAHFYAINSGSGSVCTPSEFRQVVILMPSGLQTWQDETGNPNFETCSMQHIYIYTHGFSFPLWHVLFLNGLVIQTMHI